MNKSIRIIARKDGLLVTRVGDETVIYDIESSKASCLNGLMTAIWEAIDEETNIEVLINILRDRGYPDVNEEIVYMAVHDLVQAGLVENCSEIAIYKENLSRREMIQLIGKRSVVVLPVVSTIIMQPAIAQVSCAAKHEPCTFDSDCCVGPCQSQQGWCQH